MKLIKIPVSKKAEIRLFADMALKQVLDDTTIDNIPIRKWIEKIVNNEYREVKRGKWIKGKYQDEWFCSVCSNGADLDWKENPILSDYCPKCGAEMKEGD